jgi:hypothetical protein
VALLKVSIFGISRHLQFDQKKTAGFRPPLVSMDCRVKPGNDEWLSFPRNGYSVVTGGASLAVHLHRWASLEG